MIKSLLYPYGFVPYSLKFSSVYLPYLVVNVCWNHGWHRYHRYTVLFRDTKLVPSISIHFIRVILHAAINETSDLHYCWKISTFLYLSTLIMYHQRPCWVYLWWQYSRWKAAYPGWFFYFTRERLPVHEVMIGQTGKLHHKGFPPFGLCQNRGNSDLSARPWTVTSYRLL